MIGKTRSELTWTKPLSTLMTSSMAGAATLSAFELPLDLVITLKVPPFSAILLKDNAVTSAFKCEKIGYSS